jgi:tetratricopeptide (TPR) repeat protein
MARTVAQDFDRLLAAKPARRPALARALAARGLTWDEWTAEFRRAHGQSPQHEAQAARALGLVYRRAGDRLTAARLRLMEARAVHRAGSPREATKMFEQAARALAAAGDAQRSVQARVVRVDALAHTGRVDAALREARALRPRLRGTWASAWRHVLEINAANALRLRGDLDHALARYDAAARGLVKAGRPDQAAIARVNAGVALMEGGRGEEALARLSIAEAELEAAGFPEMALQARYNRACAAIRTARLGEGVGTLERLAAQHGAQGLRRLEALCRMDLADALLSAGDRESARKEAERAAEAFASDGADAERCEALLLAGAAATEPGAAATLLNHARRAAQASQRPAVVLRCDVKSQDLRFRAGRSSRSLLLRLARQAAALGQPEVAAEAELLLGDAALSAGDRRAARTHFARAARAGAGRPWIRAAAEAGRAACLARAGKREAALTALRRVAEFLDAVRAQLPGAWLRATFVLSRLDPWLARVALLLERGRADDRREAEALLDALAARRFRERARPEAPRGDLARLRRRLEALYDRLGRGTGPTRGTTAAELRAAAREAHGLEQRVAEAWRAGERRSRAVPGDRTVRPRPAPLGPREAALHVWHHEGRIRALLRVGRTVLEPADLGPADTLVEALTHLDFLADRVRLFGAESAAPLDEHLLGLSRRLLAPLASADGIDRLHLVLDPEVPDLPWESLPRGGRPLAASAALLRVPALGVRARRSAPRAAGPTTFFAAGEADLPGIVEEARRLADRASLVLGERATRAAFAASLTAPGVVHLAGHGLTSAEAPALGGVRLVDGWFSSTDVPERVDAGLVVLGACRSGHEQGVSARAWGGLPAALLAAGARRVLWTATDVDDAAVSALTARLHAALPGAAPEVAFGRALGEASADKRVAACLLPFRMSGVLP